MVRYVAGDCRRRAYCHLHTICIEDKGWAGKVTSEKKVNGGDNMTLETRNIDGVHIVQLEGQIRISTQNDFKDHLDALSAEYGDKSVLLNMTGISYMNSAGIGIIVDAFKKFREKGGRLSMCNLTADIFRLFEVTKLNRFIQIFENEEAALVKMKV